MKKMAESTRRWACVVLMAATAVLSLGASAVTAAPGDPTAEECAIIAQNAVTNKTDFASELAKSGGGTCPDPTVRGVTVTPAQNPVAVKAAVAASGTLPKSGGNISGTLTIAGAACLVGGALVLVNRKRRALPTSD